MHKVSYTSCLQLDFISFRHEFSRSSIYLKRFFTLEEKKTRKRSARKRDQDDFFGSTPRSLRYIILLTIAASIVNFFDGWATSVMAFALPVDPKVEATGLPTIYDYFGFTMYSFHVPLIFIIAGLGVMSAIVFKWAADKYGRKPLYLITASGFIIFTVISAFVPPGSIFFPTFLLVRYFANLFLAADLIMVIITEEAPSKYRGRLIAFTVSMNLMGTLAVTMIHFSNIAIPIPTLSGILVLTTWQAMFFLNIFGFAFIFPIYAFMKETKRFQSMKKYEAYKKVKKAEQIERSIWIRRRLLQDYYPFMSKKMYLDLLEERKIFDQSWIVPLKKQYLRPLLLAVVPYVAIQMILIAVVQYMPLMLSNELYIPNWELLMIPFIIVGFAGVFFTMYVMDRWDRKVLALRGAIGIFFGGLLIAVPSAFIHPPLQYAGNWVLFAADNPGFCQLLLTFRPINIVLMISGFCIGGFAGPLTLAAISVMPLEMTPTHILGTATGWWGFFQKIPTILSPTIIFWGAMMVAGTSGVGSGGLTFAWSYFSIGIFLITGVYTIVYLAPAKGTSRGKTIEEILFTQQKLGLSRERSRKYEYILLTATYLIYFFCTYIYGFILNVYYFGFNPVIPLIQVLLIEGSISIGLMIAVIYVREKVVGVAPYKPEVKKK